MFSARAYAKINWILDVGGLRADGYHDVSTLMQTVSLYDKLYFEKDTRLSLQTTCALPTDESNLVIRAARLLQAKSGSYFGARIKLEKHIPIAAGLGGGSADAAVTLIALNQLWQLELGLDQLAEVAAKLGSDVPFFLYGGTAWALGRGTEILPAEDIRVEHLLLANPGYEISTAEVYSRFDLLTNSQGDIILPTCSFFSKNELFKQVRNSLSRVVQELKPQIATLEQRLKHLGAQASGLSGSGPTVWAAFADNKQRRKAAEALRLESFKVFEVSTISRSEYRVIL
ncbi:MAG: 4-(cytidine 5'-diphospho)-2-C-methyl-D-erythritol kinase [Acidobacteriota bacterium]|nr:4-(cytidine 5'-diphospho)-2-C-methyl-D-erythritol kinase [Blastocatellia bacterium]MDW8413680.1 4-(cytidine 5'-diphospho)-2-C-methyl-D-erythritol kinase [Acidobacteriota bacterium]